MFGVPAVPAGAPGPPGPGEEGGCSSESQAAKNDLFFGDGQHHSQGYFELPTGAGPRHLAFGAARGGSGSTAFFVYILCELSASIVVASFDACSGHFEQLQSLDAMDNGVACSRAHHSGCSGIVVSSGSGSDTDGTLYATSRTDSKVNVFRVDKDTGLLTRLGSVPSHGIGPRSLCLDSAAGRLHVANKDSQNVVTYTLGADGMVTDDGQHTVTMLPATCPDCIAINTSPDYYY